MRASTWSESISHDSRVLIVVNSIERRFDEVVATLAAVERSSALDRAAAIVPAHLRSWFLSRGLRSSRVVAPRLRGADVEFPYFLESAFAVQWAARQQCEFVLGTQPYLPLNEEVRLEFEQRLVPLLGRGQYLAHTLPDQRVFFFTAADLWNRVGRSTAVEAHASRQHQVLSEVHRRWVDLGRPSSPAYAPEIADALTALTAPAVAAPDRFAAASAAASVSLSRATDALSELATAVTAPPIRTAPSGTKPAAGWIPPHVEAIWESHYVAPEVRWEGPRMAMRGLAAGAYSYLFVSAEEDLSRGDAAVATGRVHRGGVTIGLLRNGAWINRVDIDEPGPFVVMVMAEEPGDYQLGIANCLRGTESRTAFVLRRFGWTRRER